MSDPTPQQTVIPARIDPKREYVAGSSAWLAWRNGIQSLPVPVDAVEAELGDESYARMLTDAQITANLNVLIASILDGGLQILPAELPEDDPEVEQAAAIAAFAARQFTDLDPALDDTLWDLCESALAFGAKVAETTWELASSGDDAGRYILSSFKTKPRERIAMVVDTYMNLLGMLAALPGQQLAYRGPLTPAQAERILPRSKFAVMAYHPRDADPRGRTILRSAYNPWWLKTQGWPEYLKYLVQFGTPSVIGVTAEGASGDAETGQSAEDLLLLHLLAYQNGTALAVPYGTSIDTLNGTTAAGNDVFPSAVGLFDQQITKGMLGVTRATQEAEHGSKADSGTAKDLFDSLVHQLRATLARMIRRDVLLPLINVNYGDVAVMRYMPRVLIGGVEDEDKVPTMIAVANLKRAGYLAPSQYQAVDQLIGLPPRTPEEVEALRAPSAAPPLSPTVPGDDDRAEEDGNAPA